MENLKELVSFWGGMASIIALSLTLIGFFIAFYKWGRKRREAEFAQLTELRATITERAKAATTQGKRMDLFIYYQSLLSQRRFSFTVREIQVVGIHVCSLILMMISLRRDASADYYVDRIWPPPDYLSNNFGYITIGQILVLFLMNLSLRSQLSKQRRRLNESASGLTDELQNYLEESS